MEQQTKKEKKKRNIFVRFFCAIGRGIKIFFMYLIYILIFPFVKLSTRCKVVGKENVSKDDTSKVFLANHYEIFGPVAMFMNFPYKSRIWIIDKMMDEDSVEQQMGLMVYANFKGVPRWLKTFVLKIVKSLVVFVFKHIKGIPISRENLRANLKTMDYSSDLLDKGTSIILMPELDYVSEGVGEFQTGFEYLAKIHYKKTGKKISFYPVFVSQVDKTIYIEKPITYNPDNDPNDEKQRIVTYVHDEMVKSYITHEVENPSKKMLKHRAKIKKKKEKQLKKQQKKSEKSAKQK